MPVRFVPLHKGMLGGFDGQQDGSNAFIYSRYLIPHLQDFEGWAIFCDGDMLVTEDIYELFALRDKTKAVQVVKHDYKTSQPRKYIGSPIENDNIDYPRKNWSSVIIWNCGHSAHRILTPEYVAHAGGHILHRFGWLNDDEVGEIPVEWNWLVGEYPKNPDARLLHHTLGSPGFGHYAECEGSRRWNAHLLNMLNMEGERAAEMVRRAHWRKSVKIAS